MKRKIIGKTSGANGGDMDEMTVANDNMGRKMLGRGGMRYYTSVRCHVTGGTNIKMPLLLRRLLKSDSLEVGSEGVLIPDGCRRRRIDVGRGGPYAAAGTAHLPGVSATKACGGGGEAAGGRGAAGGRWPGHM